MSGFWHHHWIAHQHGAMDKQYKLRRLVTCYHRGTRSESNGAISFHANNCLGNYFWLVLSLWIWSFILLLKNCIHGLKKSLALLKNTAIFFSLLWNNVERAFFKFLFNSGLVYLMPQWLWFRKKMPLHILTKT